MKNDPLDKIYCNNSSRIITHLLSKLTITMGLLKSSKLIRIQFKIIKLKKIIEHVFNFLNVNILYPMRINVFD